jgi:ferritin-like metal-binding protein YciE
MSVQNAQDAFLFDLSLAHAGARTTLEIVEQGVAEVTDERARTLLTEHAEAARAQVRALEEVFSLSGSQPQDLACPAIDGIRQELDLFRQQDPAPELLTATTLFADQKISHNELATYDLLLDKAVMLSQTQAARILTTILKEQKEAAGRTARLIHELLLEVAGDSGTATEVAAAGGVAPAATS